MPDPFAAYAVAAEDPQDPFAAFAEAPTPAKPKADRYEVMPFGETPRPSLSDVVKKVPSAIGEIALMQAGGAVLGAASKLPMGRLLTAGWKGAKTAAKGIEIPIIGRGAKAGIRAAAKSWKASAPKAAEAVASEAPLAAAPSAMHGPSPKPKLNAQQTAAMLRDLHGSEQAGRMLYGPVQRGSDVGSAVKSAAARKGAIKTLTPQGTTKLPTVPKGEIDARLETLTEGDAFRYAQKAPNAVAQRFFGDRLVDQVPTAAQREATIRALLMDMMKAR